VDQAVPARRPGCEVILVGMSDSPSTSPQPASVAADATALVVPLLKASLTPQARAATRPIDSPAGRIVSKVAHRDMDTGGADGTVHMAAGLVTTLSYLVPALTQALGRGDGTETGRGLAAVLRQQGGNEYLARVLETLDTGACVEVIGEAMADDDAEVYTLILAMAECAATHAEGYAHVTRTPLDEVWAEIETGLHE
jgi:hypothetical protein